MKNTFLLSFLLVITFTSLTATKCFALQGSDWRSDPEVLFADAKKIVVVTDMETGKKIITNEPATVTGCVQIDDGPCVQSDYFKATVKDVKE